MRRIHGARRLLMLVLALSSAARGSDATAQSVAGFPADAARNSIMVEASLEPELVVSIGYLYRLTSDPSRHSSLHVGGGLELPPYLVGSGSGRLNLMAKGRWIGRNDWGASVTSMAYLARNRNRAGTMSGVGFEFRTAPGYHGSHWSVTADLGWQTTFLAHIQHSDLVRRTFEERYPEGTPGPGSSTGGAEPRQGPRDGWFGATASRVRIGLSGARAISDDLSIRLAAGSLFSLQRQGLLLSFAHGQVPVYLETSLKGSW